MKNLKLMLIMAAGILSVILMCVFGIQSIQNKAIERYNRYCKSFPARIFLSWMGYEPSIYERLDYEAPVDAPQDLFEE